MLESGVPFPELPHHRLSIAWSDKENHPPLPHATNVAERPLHWLDTLEVGIQAHIEAMQTKRDELAARAQPP